MINFRKCRVLLSSLTVIFVCWGNVFAAGYTFTDLGGLFSGNSYATDISNNGQICGTYTDATGTHGYVLLGSSFVSFDVPGAVTFTVNGINDAGQIVGDYWDGSASYGYIKSDDVFTIIQSPGNMQSTVSFHAAGINNNGQVVGDYMTDISGCGMAEVRYGYILDGNVFTSFMNPDIGSNNRGFTHALDINDNGQIVGWWDDDMDDFRPGYIKDGDTYTTFRTLPGISDVYNYTNLLSFNGINNAGLMVGSYRAVSNDTYNVTKGFIGDANTFSVLFFPDAISTWAMDINEGGQIVGNYYDGSSYHAFLATPVPIPASFLLMGSGLLGLARLRKNPSNKLQ